jgi:hypothetical protein
MDNHQDDSGTGKPLRCVNYIRVSTLEQTRSGYSLPEQDHALERYAKDKNLIVVETVATRVTRARTRTGRGCSASWSSQGPER